MTRVKRQAGDRGRWTSRKTEEELTHLTHEGFSSERLHTCGTSAMTCANFSQRYAITTDNECWNVNTGSCWNIWQQIIRLFTASVVRSAGSVTQAIRGTNSNDILWKQNSRKTVKHVLTSLNIKWRWNLLLLINQSATQPTFSAQDGSFSYCPFESNSRGGPSFFLFFNSVPCIFLSCVEAVRPDG